MVGGLLLSVGIVQLASADSKEGLRFARQIGMATAVTLLTIDAIYIPKGEMRLTYLQDALCELGWLKAWSGLQ